jgi:SAM-dependent methyltransferase
MTPTDQPETTEDLSKLYGEEYYRSYCGSVPYSRSELPHWSAFFGTIADELIRAIQPKRVLDAGCALGFLVEAFWDRGVEARGMDVSSYAISQVRRDLQPYCQVGSIVDGIEAKYDLITCIEVLEHIPEAQGLRAIENLTRATGTIVFSSTPYDVDEQTHFNVRPIIHWLQLFREHGFSPDLGFDLNFICDHAILFRRSNEPLSDEVLRLYSRFVRQRHDIFARDAWVRQHAERIAALTLETQELNSARQQLHALESAQQEIQINLEAANQHVEELIHARSVQIERADDNPALKTLEFRIGGLEDRYAQLSHNVRGILESRIWRTLVKFGGIVQKVF